MQTTIITSLLIFSSLINAGSQKASIYIGKLSDGTDCTAKVTVCNQKTKDLEILILKARMALVILSKKLTPDTNKRIIQEQAKKKPSKHVLLKLKKEQAQLEKENQALRRIISNGNSVLKAYKHKWPKS